VLKQSQRQTQLGSSKRAITVASFLGVLSATNSIALGFYLSSIYFSPFPTLYSPIGGYFAGGLTLLSAVMLVLGSFLVWKGSAYKGGIMNLVAGAILAVMYFYFAFLSQPPLLSWLGFVGIFSLAPAVISGVTGIALKR